MTSLKPLEGLDRWNGWTAGMAGLLVGSAVATPTQKSELESKRNYSGLGSLALGYTRDDDDETS